MRRSILNYVATLSAISLTLGCMLFISCGEDSSPASSGGSTTVNGTLTLPSEASGKTYAVLIDNDANGDNGYVKMTTGTCGAGTEEEYSISSVSSGTYYVYAAVFVVSDGSQGPQSGDYFGFYNPGGSPDTPPSSANADVPSDGTVTFDITLVVW